MNAENEIRDDRAEQEEPAAEKERFEARRRLMKAGLIAVPFLVTLHAVPLRAQAQGSLGFYGYGGGGGGDRSRRPQSGQPSDSSRPSYLDSQ